MDPKVRIAGRKTIQLAHLLRRRLDQVSKSEGLAGAQGKILRYILSCQGDVFQKDIEEVYGIRASSATALLKQMERDGLIIREELPRDRRMKRLIPTEKALQYSDPVLSGLDELEAELSKGITREQLDTYLETIEMMIKNMMD